MIRKSSGSEGLKSSIPLIVATISLDQQQTHF